MLWNHAYVIRSRIEVAVLFPDHLRVHACRKGIHVEDINLNSGSLRLEERSRKWENSYLDRNLLRKFGPLRVLIIKMRIVSFALKDMQASTGTSS